MRCHSAASPIQKINAIEQIGTLAEVDLATEDPEQFLKDVLAAAGPLARKP